MANTSTISQLVAQSRFNASLKQPGNPTKSDGENFRDIMNQTKDVSKTDKPESKQEPSDPIGKQDEIQEPSNPSEDKRTAFALQAMAGELLVGQEPAVPVLDITAEIASASGRSISETQGSAVGTSVSMQDAQATELVQGQLLAGEQKPAIESDKGIASMNKIPASEKQTDLNQSTAATLQNEETATVPVQGKQPSDSGNIKDDTTAFQQKSLLQAELNGKVVVKEEVKSEAKLEDITVLSDLQPKEGKTEKSEMIRIKVAEPFRQVTPDVMNQISGSIKEQAMLGREELVIQLEPEHLGKIAIKISMEDSGVKVILNCESAKTQSLLAEKAAGIGRIVEDNMNRPVVVEMKEDGYWNQQKDATDQHANQNQRQQEQTEKQGIEDTDLFIQQLRLGLSPQQIIAS